MTAEIAILNKEAIALAADSAVTIQRGNEQKIFTSANKIFSLLHSNPIAIMIYNNATFMGIPWEIIVKLYRDKHASTSFDTLEECAEAFISFLATDMNYVPETAQADWISSLTYTYYEEIKSAITSHVEDLLDSNTTITPELTKEIISKCVKQYYDYLANGNKVAEVDDSLKDIFYAQFGKDIKSSISSIFEKLPLTKSQKSMLFNMPYLLLTNYPTEFDFSDYTGVVITGYGKYDIFPKLRTYMINGKYKSFIKHKIDRRDTIISHDKDATIIPFAQSDMVHTFMEGVNNDLLREMQEDFNSILKNYPQIIIDKITSLGESEKRSIIKDLQKIGKEEYKKYIDKFKTYRSKNYVKPIVEVVSFLPKDELAAMAESLVNITSFKRRISMELETVGGPIDVAVISKKDGFIWIKRKHYFEKSLNNHFFNNR